MCQAVGSDSESAEKPSNWWSIHKALDSDQGSIHCKFSIQATLSEFYQICTCRTNMQVSSSPHAKFSTACRAQHRIWASDRRFRHGLQDSASACYFCLQGEDIADHILVQSAKQIWYTWFLQLQFDASIPEATHTLHEWWQDSETKAAFWQEQKKDSQYDDCSIRKCRNAWVFNKRRLQMSLKCLASRVIIRIQNLGESRSWSSPITTPLTHGSELLIAATNSHSYKGMSNGGSCPTRIG
jgi:hypothetical protein